jgi:hypothetical protein
MLTFIQFASMMIFQLFKGILTASSSKQGMPYGGWKKLVKDAKGAKMVLRFTTLVYP